MSSVLRGSLLTILTMSFIGCMDGPFYAMKRVNPYYLSQWRADRAHGPTFEDRFEELRQLAANVESMSAAEQEQATERFNAIVMEDPSPELRAIAVQGLAKVSSPAAEKGLNSASTDEVEKVRLAASTAWRYRGGEAARNMLLSMASSDNSGSVRQSAIESLAAFNEPEVLRTMSTLLDDTSPAIQFTVAQSLATLTGQDFGGDFSQWKNHVDSIAPAGAEATSNLPEFGGLPVLPASGQSSLPNGPNTPKIP